MEYCFHLMFADGSNPYLSFPADEVTHKRRLRIWRTKYRLHLDGTTHSPDGLTTEWYTAAEKRPRLNGLFEGENDG